MKFSVNFVKGASAISIFKISINIDEQSHFNKNVYLNFRVPLLRKIWRGSFLMYFRYFPPPVLGVEWWWTKCGCIFLSKSTMKNSIVEYRKTIGFLYTKIIVYASNIFAHNKMFESPHSDTSIDLYPTERETFI